MTTVLVGSGGWFDSLDIEFQRWVLDGESLVMVGIVFDLQDCTVEEYVEMPIISHHALRNLSSKNFMDAPRITIRVLHRTVDHCSMLIFQNPRAFEPNRAFRMKAENYFVLTDPNLNNLQTTKRSKIEGFREAVHSPGER